MDPSKLHQAKLTLINETTCVDKWGDFVNDAHICLHPAGSASCTVPELVLILVLFRRVTPE